MILEYLIKFRLLITLFLMPIIAYIIRTISPPIYLNKFKEFNDKSYFAPLNKFILKNQSMENSLNIQDYNNSRIYFETKNNKIYLYLTLSKENYYKDKRIEFSIYLDINNYTNITYINNSFYFSENFENNTKNIHFKKIKESFFNMKINYLLKYISIKFDTNYTNLECKLFFEDFDLIFYLQKEKYTYKFYGLLENLISSIYLFIIICINVYELDHNLQNIPVNFLFIMRSKIVISIISRAINLLNFRKILSKILKFYFHLLLYGECILTLSDIMIIIILFIFLINFGNYLQILNDNEGNYFYCFNNKIENNKIVPNEPNNTVFLTRNYIKFSIIFLTVVICDKSSITQLHYIPLYFGIISAIHKQLTQREITYLGDKQFCINFNFYGIIIYSYYLFINSIGGAFYLIKSTFSIYPFIIIFILYIILYYVIDNEYKYMSAMKEDFEKLKKIDKECCSICLKDFCYNEMNNKKLICKVSQDDNIHKTECNHYFHEKCLFIWRKHNNICPICKMPLMKPIYYYFYEYTSCIYKSSWK